MATREAKIILWGMMLGFKKRSRLCFQLLYVLGLAFFVWVYFLSSSPETLYVSVTSVSSESNLTTNLEATTSSPNSPSPEKALMSVKENERPHFFVSEEESFIINSSSCRIPDFHPLHPSIKKFLSAPKPIRCSPEGLLPLTSIVNGSFVFFHAERVFLYEKANANKTVIKIDLSNLPNKEKEKKIKEYEENKEFEAENKQFLHKIKENETRFAQSASLPEVYCCYRSIHRIEQTLQKFDSSCDKKWRLSKDCTPILETVTYINHEGIFIICGINDNIVYKNVHYLFPSKKTHHMLGGVQENVNSKLREDRKSATSLNVILFGIDGVSRLNFIRQMPKTYTYLKHILKALEFKAYNKVGDNTFPNLVTLLTGTSVDELRKICFDKSRPFDNCSFIWRDFKEAGYVTAYVEDASWMGTFNFNRKGFVVKPVDVYGRPFFQASEKLIGHNHQGNANVCQGSLLSIEVVQDYAVGFLRSFQNSSKFGLFWSASLTHDYLNMASHADQPTYKFLKTLNEEGLLESTVLIILSDHGLRWGGIRSTFIGMMEERLPALFIALPSWFNEKHSSAYKNMVLNTRRLTSNYDIYRTLQDIVKAKSEGQEREVNERGISLFKEIPQNRTCEDAGIPDHFCTCRSTEFIPVNNPVIVQASNFLMQSINKSLYKYKQCIQFIIVNATASHAITWDKSALIKNQSAISYLLQATLKPGDVSVEATIKHLPLDNYFKITDEISRINEYGSQSHCITHSILRKYCVCKDYLLQEKRVMNKT